LNQKTNQTDGWTVNKPSIQTWKVTQEHTWHLEKKLCTQHPANKNLIQRAPQKPNYWLGWCYGTSAVDQTFPGTTGSTCTNNNNITR